MVLKAPYTAPMPKQVLCASLQRTRTWKALNSRRGSSISNTEMGGANERVDAAVNIPLVDNVVAARVNLGYEDLSGWIDRPDQKDANTNKRFNARIKIKAQPTDNLTIGLLTWISRSDFGALDDSPNNRTITFRNDEPGSTNFDAYGLSANYRFADFTVTANTSFLSYSNRFYWQEQCQHPAIYEQQFPRAYSGDRFVRPKARGLGAGPRVLVTAMARTAFTNRLRPLIIGRLFHGRIDVLCRIWGSELSRVLLIVRSNWWSSILQRSRYAGEKISDTVPPSGLYSRGANFSAVSPRFVVKWKPDDASMFYASYSEGFGRDPIRRRMLQGRPPIIPVLDREYVPRNYELGTKSSLWATC